MILPTSLNIGPFDVKVEITEPGGLIRGEKGGTWDDATNVIQIDPYMCEQKQWETMIHEVVHGMAQMHGLELTEQDVCTLSIAFYGFMKDNREILKELK